MLLEIFGGCSESTVPSVTLGGSDVQIDKMLRPADNARCLVLDNRSGGTDGEAFFRKGAPLRAIEAYERDSDGNDRR